MSCLTASNCTFIKADIETPCVLDSNKFFNWAYYLRVDCTNPSLRETRTLPATVELVDTYLRSIKKTDPTAEVIVTVEVDGEKDATLKIQVEDEESLQP